jgi:drug/metabolite transporter (DMT)-like permease
MKIEKFVLSTLKILGLILGVGGALMIYGSVGAFELDNITWYQWLVQEILSILCVFLSLVLFVVRENLKEKCLKRIEVQKYVRR